MEIVRKREAEAEAKEKFKKEQELRSYTGLFDQDRMRSNRNAQDLEEDFM